MNGNFSQEQINGLLTELNAMAMEIIENEMI